MKNLSPMPHSNAVGQYIVIDIEANKFSGDTEIIQLSAHRVVIEIINNNNEQLQQLKIADSFDTLVKPNHPLNKKVSKLTGFTQESFEDAPSFEVAFHNFVEWIQSSGIDATRLMAWGNRDKAFLDKEMARYGLPKLEKQHLKVLDLQLWIMLSQKKKEPPALSKMVQNFKGVKHNSYYDALNLAELLVNITNPAN